MHSWFFSWYVHILLTMELITLLHERYYSIFNLNPFSCKRRFVLMSSKQCVCMNTSVTGAVAIFVMCHFRSYLILCLWKLPATSALLSSVCCLFLSNITWKQLNPKQKMATCLSSSAWYPSISPLPTLYLLQIAKFITPIPGNQRQPPWTQETLNCHAFSSLSRFTNSSLSASTYIFRFYLSPTIFRFYLSP